MGFFATILDLTLAAGIVVGWAIGIMFLAIFGIVVQAGPFLIKLAAVAALAYFGLNIFGII